jgi:hypothetical protein
MDWSKYKSVKKGAAEKAVEIFNRHRKQKPSERLIKIIAEVGEQETEKEDPSKPGKAAKQPEV